MRIYQTFLCALLMGALALPVTVSAQRTSGKYAFTLSDGYFLDLQNSYVEVVSAEAYNRSDAHNQAMQKIIERRSMATGSSSHVTIGADGSVSVESDHNVIVKARILNEYVQVMPHGYRVYLLVQTAKNPMYQYEPVSVSDYYSAGARVLVPGWAQLYKGNKTKGSLIIAAELLSVAGIVLCENQRSDYNNKALEQPRFAQQYYDKASNWETARNISIGVAASVWVYSLIDGLVSKGKQRVLVGRAPSRGLSLMPTLSDKGAGLSLAYHF